MNTLHKIRRLIGETDVAFTADPGALELVALMAAQQGQRRHRPDMREAFDIRERQVCKAVRNGRLQLDFVPPADGTVTLPATDHPLYMQTLVYWAASLGEPIMVTAEACRRAGNAAPAADVKAAAKKIAFEARTMRTDHISMSDFGGHSQP